MMLKDLEPGDLGVVLGFEKSSVDYRKKLLAMGLTHQTQFKVIRKAPLGDPIEIEVRGYNLTLRKEESALVKIERVS